MTRGLKEGLKEGGGQLVERGGAVTGTISSLAKESASGVLDTSHRHFLDTSWTLPRSRRAASSSSPPTFARRPARCRRGGCDGAGAAPPLNLLGTFRTGAVADVGTSTLALARPLAAGGGGGEEGEEEGAAAEEESGSPPPPELAPFEAPRPAVVVGRWRKGRV